ncbi:MAG: SDR family NAD(P)-dependent oxidoreductase [Pseudomonadota bacterium]
MLLKNRIAIITGAGSDRGIGRATAELFAENGAKVVVLDIDIEGARRTAKALTGRGHLAIKCDVSKRRDCERVVERVSKKWGRLDVVVNNAGVVSPDRVSEVDDATYNRIFDINMRGTFHMTQAALPLIRNGGAGSIINVSSVAAQRGGGIFGGSHYAASKAAMIGYTKAAARELAPENIRVNVICPSYIDTDITADTMSDEQRAAVIAAVPMGRAGTAREVAGSALFLASDLSTYVTGTEMDVNGGSHIH